MTFNQEAGLPKVSVILVTYNAVTTLQNSLDSIYRQTYPFLEIIIIDGGSNDGTLNVLKANSGKISFWKSEPDNGIYDAMNKAVQFITGQWVYFLGADDELLPDFSKLLYELKDNKTIYYGQALRGGTPIPPAAVDAYRHAKVTICHQAIVYPASVFKKYTYNTKYPIAADHLLNMQCWGDGSYTFKFINLIIAVFSDQGISSVKDDVAFKKDQSLLILKHHGPLIWFRYVFKHTKDKLLGRGKM